MGSRIRPLSQVDRLFDVYCEVSFVPHADGNIRNNTNNAYYNQQSPQPQFNFFDDEFVPQDLILIRRQSSCVSNTATTQRNRASLDHNHASAGAAASDRKSSKITYQYPSSNNQLIDPDILKSIPSFAHPCSIVTDSVIHFTFVLTSADSRWKFGFVRATNDQALVILSSLPWNDAFFKILNHVHSLSSTPGQADLLTQVMTACGSSSSKEPESMREKFLSSLYTTSLPEIPGQVITITYMSNSLTSSTRLSNFTMQTVDHENRLPNIPEDRNLTEYLNACDPVKIMIPMFASVLHERRIIVTSSRLCRLTSIIQSLNLLINPMFWQHIFIPVLPAHLTDYLSAPMPFLIGVPAETMSAMMRDNRSCEWGDGVVILDADTGIIESPFQDVASLPTAVVNFLKKSLSLSSSSSSSHKYVDTNTSNDMTRSSSFTSISSHNHSQNNSHSLLGDRIPRSFLKAMVMMIGGYRDALVFPAATTPDDRNEITFDPNLFVNSRCPQMQSFLERMLQLQIFQQFIQSRIKMLHDGFGLNDEFEREVGIYELEGFAGHGRGNSNNGQFKHFKTQYNEWLTKCKKTSKGSKDFVMKQVNHPAFKSAVKQVKSGSKSAVRAVKKGITNTQQRVQSGISQTSSASGSRHTGSRPKTMHQFYSTTRSPDEPEVAVEVKEEDDGTGKLSRVLTIEKTAKTATYVRPAASSGAAGSNGTRKPGDSPPDLIALSLDDGDDEDDEETEEEDDESNSDPLQFDPLFNKQSRIRPSSTRTTTTSSPVVPNKRNGMHLPLASVAGADGGFFAASLAATAANNNITNNQILQNSFRTCAPLLPPPPHHQVHAAHPSPSLIGKQSHGRVQTRKAAASLPQLVSLSPPEIRNQSQTLTASPVLPVKQNGIHSDWQMFE